MNLKNTTIEELFLEDEAAMEFFYNSPGRSELCVEKVSFGSKSTPQNETFLKLIERVQGGNVTQGKIKTLVLNRSNFFDFLEEANRTAQKEIHVEELLVTQKGKDSGPETKTSIKIAVSKKVCVRGNVRVLLFIELAPEISHFDICEIQKQCRSPRIDIPRINIQVTKNKINIKGSIYALQFLKKNITATEVCFFTTTEKETVKKTKITLAAGEMESILFRNQGLSVLLSLTNEKINTGYMAVMDTMCCFSDQEKEKIRGKEFVIRERLHMKNAGILFLELLGKTVFIPVIEIEVDRFTVNCGGFRKINEVHIETNALLEKISPGIKSAGYIKQKIGEIIAQKEPVVKAFSRYQKPLFEEDIEHEEQHEQGESREQPTTKSQWREEIGMDACRCWFSRYPTEFYED
ncbi:MAG: uncharacterized protein A8A55_2118 [Amphiamblys sp. WSBS2006]|nr:MAG: uncharacterized protein A8A55_2118 [Amphiamblys sp. WSBS2006]